jgi:signal transduction histidine kinase
MQKFTGIRFHLFVALSILFVCLASQNSWALALKPADGLEGPVSLSGHLAIFHDPAGTLSISDIASGRSDIQFQAIPSMLTQGYRKGAIWVRFSLSAPTASKQWLLQVERPLIEHVTLYVPDGAGHLVVEPPTGLHPGPAGEARAYPNLFPIAVPSTESEFYVRLESMTSITTALFVWQQKGYDNHRRSDHWIIGIVAGAVGAMIFANLLYAAWLRDDLYLLYAAVLVESGLMTLFHMGYASEVLYFLEPKQIYRSWGAIVCLYSLVMVLFLARLFEFRHHWIWAWRLLQGIALLNAGAFIFAIIGRYGDVGFFVSRLQQLSFIFIALHVLYLLIVRRQHQYLLPALAFTGVITASLIMQAQYTGNNFFRIDGSLASFMAVGTLIHLVLFSAAVAKRAQLAERSLSEEKDRVIALSRSAERELTIKVRERTAELAERNASLKAEIDRRHALEVKLRQSLDSVNDALAQQRDFLALVSHEFRAPLSVIAAAADNLLHYAAESTQNIKLRAIRIRQTVKRMSMLIENVLAGDRLNAGKMPFDTIEILDLNEILRTVQAGLDDDAAKRAGFISGNEALVKGDRTLLETVLQNLIQNALKYSPSASAVTVQLSTDRDVVFVDVSDEGAGVAPGDRELIFTKYFRAAGQQVSGSGLGLYISKEIARQYAGDLILAASDISGSTFRLSLPIETSAGRE